MPRVSNKRSYADGVGDARAILDQLQREVRVEWREVLRLALERLNALKQPDEEG